MAKVIEAKAVISGEDRLSKVLDGLNKKFKEIGKGAKVSADVARLNKELEQAQKGLLAIEKLRNTQASFGAARTKYRAAQEDVARLAKELEAARKAAAQFDGVKAFGKNSAIAKEMTDARRRVTELEGSLKGAQREVRGASAEFERQTAAIKSAKRAADEAGISIRRLGNEEAHLKGKVQLASERLERQAALHGDGRGGGLHPGVPTRARVGSSFGDAAATGLSAGAAIRYGAGAVGVMGVTGQFRRAYDSSVSFERSMIEVGKATDTSGADLDAYGERLLKLARQTGKTKEELASMLSSAGFAGRPKEDLMDFTEYASKATVAWGTNAEETGQALAQIGNIYEANQKRIEEIGDAINTMADNSASKETDLLDFMTRAGPSAKDIGIQPEQLLPFGAAMKEVGVRNETAGTAYEALLNVMKLGDKFSKSAGNGLKALGINSDKMRKAFVAKPVETMMGLLEKIDKISDKNKKAEIMTDLLGKEFQDDIAKMLNALPKLHQYLELLQDKARLLAGGVRFQFDKNLDKDVSKIDRATQALDVLYKRVGDPIKVQAGSIAEEINKMVDKIEKGDTLLQRLMQRVTGVAPDGPIKEIDPSTAASGKTTEQWFEEKAPWLSGKTWNDWIDSKIGRTGDETDWLNRRDAKAAATAKEEAHRRSILGRPAEIDSQIQRRQAVLDRSRERAGGAPGIQRDMAQSQVGKSEAEIARLKGELSAAWEAIGALRAQDNRNRGAFTLNGPGGKIGDSIGSQSFGFGVAGSQALPSRSVPLPPQRPAEFGRMDQTITAEVKSMPPLSGEVSGQATVSGSFTIEPSQWFVGKFNGMEQAIMTLSGKVASFGSLIAANGPGSTGKSSPDAGKGGRD